MTLEEFYKATEGMPMNAKIQIDKGDEYEYEWVAPEIVCNIEKNTIRLC